MKFNQINRNSLMSGLYSERPSYNLPLKVDEQHLNPSKSKVNIRQSLNKTTENYTTNNPTINNIRNSCVLNTSLTTNSHIIQQTLDEKVFKSTKENQDPVVQKYRDNFGRYNSVMPSPNFNEERRKSDSVHCRMPSRQEFILKFEEQQMEPKVGNTEQVRAQIAALAKRVSANEQQIARLKQRNGKDKKWQNLQNQLSEYRNKILQYYKFNSNHFNEIESKMQQYQQQLGQLREQWFHGQNQKSQSCHSVENQLHEFYDQFKRREGSTNQLLIRQTTTTIESSIKKWINNQINMLNSRLDKASDAFSAVNRKITKIQQNFEDKKKKQQYKRSHKKCNNSITFENKEVLIIKEDSREGELFKEKSKPLSNYYDQASKRQYYDQTPRKDYAARKELLEQPKRQLIIKQRTYYIDSEGYLLDENKYYLLNSQNEQILIPEHMIACLKDNNILAKK